MRQRQGQPARDDAAGVDARVPDRRQTSRTGWPDLAMPKRADPGGRRGWPGPVGRDAAPAGRASLLPRGGGRPLARGTWPSARPAPMRRPFVQESHPANGMSGGAASSARTAPISMPTTPRLPQRTLADGPRPGVRGAVGEVKAACNQRYVSGGERTAGNRAPTRRNRAGREGTAGNRAPIRRNRVGGEGTAGNRARSLRGFRPVTERQYVAGPAGRTGRPAAASFRPDGTWPDRACPVTAELCVRRVDDDGPVNVDMPGGRCGRVVRHDAAVPAAPSPGGRRAARERARRRRRVDRPP